MLIPFASELVAPLLKPRLSNIVTAVLGGAWFFFSGISYTAGLYAKAECSKALFDAIFANANGALSSAAPCLISGAISAIAGSIAFGITAVGVKNGFTKEGAGDEIGPMERGAVTPYIDKRMGVSHHNDLGTHMMLHHTYGDMLAAHNTTISSVTWLENLPTANHTGGPFEHLDMTHGRIVTLNDSGVVRTALGYTDMLGQILDDFNYFKETQLGKPSRPLKKRQDDGTLTVNYLTFNTYGENTSEGQNDQSEIDEDMSGAEDSSNYLLDQNFIQGGDGRFADKVCMAAGLTDSSYGTDSIILGELYMNQYGGVDDDCLSV